MGELGERAERIAEERIRGALPADARCYANVRFVARTRPTGPAHDGEADLVIVHPEHGVLVIEVKSGEPSASGGTWFIGGKLLTRSPFKQAEDAKHDLVGAIGELLGVRGEDRPRAGHAVAFPDADLASLPAGHALLSPDARNEIILDAAALADTASTTRALERAWDWWTGDGTRGRPLTPAQVDRIHEFLEPTVAMRRLIHRDVEDSRDRLVVASRAQLIVLNQNRSRRRAEVIGPAGSGKSLVAIEKARRLAREGFRTLFVCFNQPLATAVGREIDADDEPQHRRPHVTTFHRLCEVLGRRAGVLPPKPAAPIPVAWWNETLPGALDGAIDALPDERFQAVIVDEGQDFELPWLTSLEFLFRTPEDGVFWVFHDPGQALRGDDRVGELGLERLELAEDYRSPAPVAALAARFYRGPMEPYAMGESGRAPSIIEAERGRATVEEVRRVLHRLLVVEGVRPWQVAVLSGVTARDSDVWRQRRFGNVELWNGAVDDDGNSRGLPADEVPDEPPDAGIVLFESIRRFKGLEREVVILCELPVTGDRLDQLLYSGLTRATAHLVVIAPPALAARLRAGEAIN
jgi:hypothetical protein